MFPFLKLGASLFVGKKLLPVAFAFGTVDLLQGKRYRFLLTLVSIQADAQWSLPAGFYLTREYAP